MIRLWLMKSIKQKRDYHTHVFRPYQFLFRLTDTEYESVAHRVFDSSPLSINEFLIREIFKNGWQKKLDRDRRRHQKMGYNPQFFLHPRRRKELGIPEADQKLAA